jgi:uncharacterized protein YkwD
VLPPRRSTIAPTRNHAANLKALLDPRTVLVLAAGAAIAIAAAVPAAAAPESVGQTVSASNKAGSSDVYSFNVGGIGERRMASDAGAGSCQDADVEPTPDNLAEVADAIFCLTNVMREDNGLPDLTPQSQLAQASLEHSHDMVHNHYFGHDSLDGTDFVARLRAVGYISSDSDLVGENLAWGSGSFATPSAVVDAWMNSPPHREKLLATNYQEVGLGVAYGTPDASAPDGVTVTTDFGSRIAASAPAVVIEVVTRRRTPTRCMRRHRAARRRCVRAAARSRRRGGQSPGPR